MWRIIVTLLYVLVVESRPMEQPMEGPLWTPSIAKELFLRSHPKSQRNFHEDTYDLDEDYEVAFMPPKKKTLMHLSLWSPISNIGKNRALIRSGSEAQLSKDQRSRIKGQPLRWG